MTEEKEKLMPELFIFICNCLCSEHNCIEHDRPGACVCDAMYALDTNPDATFAGCVKREFRWFNRNKMELPPCLHIFEKGDKLISFIKIHFDELNKFRNEYNTEWNSEDMQEINQIEIERKVRTYVVEKLTT